MRRTGLYLAVLCQACCLLAAAAEETRSLAPPGGGFSIDMPVEPKLNKQVVNGITNYVYMTEKPDGTIYSVSYFDLPPNLSIPADKAISSYAAGRKAQVLSQNRVVIDGEYPGQEAVVQLAGGTKQSRIRVFAIRKRQFQVLVDGSAEAVKSPVAEKFFSSFRAAP